ncbi:MAG: hypothetical protein A2283_22445 [Lentisphaerae bacterium RIFOXYA12_FULL_48_11]|nr:MAG: hypothetical protein A2283_22445 [Lentisphaerae bacterium RIFOXYA12_FULL_48_11]
MNEQDNSFKGNYAEEGELTTPAGQHLPRVLDPVVTMGVVQKYIETEQQRSRRVLFWMSTVFVFAALIILVLFILVGTFLYQNSRKAVDISDSIRAQVASYSAEVIGISNKLSTLEAKDSQLNELVKSVDNNRTEENRLFKTDLQRFSRWVESLNARDVKVLSELETRMREMQRMLEAKDKELEEMKKQYSALLTSAGPTRSYINAPTLVDNESVSKPEKVDAPDIDITSISTVGVFDAVVSLKETNILAGVQSKGEVSVVTFPGGDKYEGEFKGGLLNGRGIYYYRNGDRYEGEFRNDMKSGLGVYYYSNGDRYTGEFGNDMKDGKGSFVFRNGEKYVGDFRNDVMIGKGTMLYQNGNKYAGDFKNGLKNGNGILSFHNGDIYKGDFKEDLRNGKGIYFFVDGAKYIGDFKNDKRHGQGRYIYPGGEEYVGAFKEGKKSGEGVCVYPNGRQFKGLWKDDKLVEVIQTVQ